MKRHWRIDPLDALWMCLVLVVVAIAASGQTETDVWGHIRFGLDILRTRHLPAVDSYSFTSTQNWVNHEWLSQLLYAGAYRLGGVPSLLAVRALSAALLLAILSRAMRGLPWTWRALLLLGVIVVAIPQLRAVRPQVFSLAIYALVLAGLESDARWLPALFALWANLHGGWLIGICAVATRAFVAPTTRRIFLAAACGAATLLNPYGLNLWTALGEATARGWNDVTEWQPVWRLSLGVDAVLLWLVTTAGVGWALWRRPDIGRFELFWTLAVAVAAARAQRLLGFYGLTAAMCVIARVRFRDPAFRIIAWDRRSMAVCGAALVIAAGLSSLALSRSMICLPAASPPVSPEAAAVSYIQRAQLRGRVVMWFDWGLYAIWHVGDRLSVSIDNRRETVYSADVVNRHIAFYEGRDDQYPDELRADYVWLPAAMPVVQNLRHRGWRPLFEGPRSIIMSRSDARAETSRVPAPRGACFPNP
jgi:hypothetical protein